MFLYGSEGTSARGIAQAIGEALARFVDKPVPRHADAALDPALIAAQSTALARGSAGLGLFLDYLDRALPGRGFGARARHFLDTSERAVAERPMTAALFGGIAGVAWVLHHLSSSTESGEDDALAPVDELLETHLRARPWRNRWDLLSGLVGLGVFAVERLPRPAARAALEAVVERLDELGERRAGGIAWLTPVQFLPLDQRQLAPAGYFNLGVAHGVPGVIALLGQAVEHDVAISRAGPLLDGAVRWLLSQPRPPEGIERFGSWVTPAGEVRGGRGGWCYGDAAVAVALLGAARRAGVSEWEAAALAIARDTVQQDPRAGGVFDAPLCHGAAGRMHMCDCLYRATGDPTYAGAARAWYAELRGMRREDGSGVAGFVSQEGAELACPGFLCGASGVGLALLAAATPIEPRWERLLLLSVPPSPAVRNG